MGKYIKCIPTDRVNNWQSVDFIFDQRVYSIEEAAGKAIKVVRRLSGQIRKLGPPLLSVLLYYNHKRSNDLKQWFGKVLKWRSQ